MAFKFNRGYFIWAVVLFIIEVLIALYMHDSFVRPFGGDVLVVILLYCMLKSAIVIKVNSAAVMVLLFAFFIETMQYLHIVNLLGLQNSKLACTIIGTTFQWTDILAYTLGIVLVLLAERLNRSFPSCSTL